MKVLQNSVLLYFSLIVNAVYGQLPNTGLYFYSHQYNIDKRTSFILNDNEPYRLNSEDVFSLDFDVFLRDEKVKFGDFFRILSDKKDDFHLTIKDDVNNFFVINNQVFHLDTKPREGQWNHVSVIFDKKSNKISLRFNDEIKDCPYDLSETNSLLVYFGLCDIKGFVNNDVSPIVLKDIIVQYDGKKLHHWVLGRHARDMVYDELKKKPAIARNPYWLMDNRIHWEKCAEFESDVFTQITFDSISNRIFILKSAGLIDYSLATNTSEVIPLSGTTPQNKFYNRLLFDPVSRQLLYYSFDSGQNYFINIENKTTGGYQFGEEGEPTHAHHNRYISPRDSMLYLFGGYGFYQYKSDFFRVNLETNKKTLFDLSHTITPRYLAAMGGNKAGDKLYIFGGRGAEMGRQELSPKNFSDLYEIDLNTIKVKHLFDLDKQYDEDNIYSNSLVVDDKDNCFYVLAYPNSKYLSAITLKKINFSTHEVETLADTIKFYFRDVDSFCDLYYSPRLSKLIAVASYSEDQQTAKINVYTLDYPPLKESDVIQRDQPSAKSTKIFLIIFSVVVFIFILLFLILRNLRKKNKRKDKEIPRQQHVTEESISPVEVEKSFYADIVHKKSILLLGGFQVYNNEGNNITGEFTPTLKFILVLILLYTFKNNKGISSTKLQELLWFDKSEEAARNNRSVNMRKLRVLLQTVGNTDINNDNSYWTISISPDVFSDYWEALKLIKKIQSDNAALPDDMSRLLELLSYGPMLPNIQFEWVDSFKNDFANSVIDVLLDFVNSSTNTYANNQDFRLKIADAILKMDPINDDAIAIKCNALFKMGKRGLAKTAFDNFNKEYKLLLGEDYKGSLKNFLN